MLTATRLPFLGFVLLLMLPLQMAFAQQKLHYQASYTGVLSLFQTLDIADVWYDISQAGPLEKGGQLQHVSLSVSSENFSMIERLYPIRYQFQSFHDESADRTVLFENLKVSDKGKKYRHKVGLFDLEKSEVQLFSSNSNKVSITTAQALESVTRGNHSDIREKLKLEPKAPALNQLHSSPIDRLTLLSKIKSQVKDTAAQRDYFVTSGDEVMTYKVELGKPELIQLGEKKVEAIKVKIEAYDIKAEKKQQAGHLYADDYWNESIMAGSSRNEPAYRHPPVYAWFSTDERCIPLKFVNHHAVGEFVVELVSDV